MQFSLWLAWVNMRMQMWSSFIWGVSSLLNGRVAGTKDPATSTFPRQKHLRFAKVFSSPSNKQFKEKHWFLFLILMAFLPQIVLSTALSLYMEFKCFCHKRVQSRFQFGSHWNCSTIITLFTISIFKINSNCVSTMPLHLRVTVFSIRLKKSRVTIILHSKIVNSL